MTRIRNGKREIFADTAHKAALRKLIAKTAQERRKTELTAALQELETGSGKS